MGHPVRTQARALLLRDRDVALVRQILRPGEHRWVLPGGGQDAGEDLPRTLVRECREELAVDVAVGGLRLVREYVPGRHDGFTKLADDQCIDFVFAVHLAPPDQEIGIGPGLEADSDRVAWWPLHALPPMYPDYLADWLPRQAEYEGVTYAGNVI